MKSILIFSPKLAMQYFHKRYYLKVERYWLLPNLVIRSSLLQHIPYCDIEEVFLQPLHEPVRGCEHYGIPKPPDLSLQRLEKVAIQGVLQAISRSLPATI
jgi:hypothetical protein